MPRPLSEESIFRKGSGHETRYGAILLVGVQRTKRHREQTGSVCVGSVQLQCTGQTASL